MKIRKKIKSLFEEIIKNQLENQNDLLLYKIQRLIITANLHKKTFSEYKNIYNGKSVAIVGPGPSVNKFKTINDCIYIGLNRACQIKQISFDYLFTIDKIGIEHIYSDFASIKCTKFVGDQNLGPKFQIPESVISTFGDVRRYKTDAGITKKSQFALDIETQPLGNYNSVSLQAAQFALYTNPKRIYLIGLDCSPNGHFNDNYEELTKLKNKLKRRNEDINIWSDDTIKYWKEFKNFAQTYYPDTEIFSINPVGLRGIFTDFFQQ